MDKPNIILTGFMATGKTTVGQLLADTLGYEFIDTDSLIEARSGQTVAEIFKNRGESVFRDLEAAVSRELGRREGLVISTGGGLMLDAANAAALSRGRVFCLVATPDEILKRASKNRQVKRPLLEGADAQARIEALLKEREDAYRQFFQLETTAIPPGEVVQKIIGLYRAEPDP